MMWIFTTVSKDHVCEQFVFTKLPTWDEYTKKAQLWMPAESFRDMMASLAKGGENPHASVTHVYGFYVIGFRVVVS